MTKKAKLLERIRNNPKDAKFSEVQQLLKDVGFSERHPKGGSSHYIYYHESLDRIVTPDLVNYGVLWCNILDKNRPLGKMF